MRLGRLIFRVFIGGLFMGHGAQKLLGWFGGPGLDGASGFMESLGLRPGRRNAIAASGTETVCGAMLVAGALTPLAAAGLIGTMLTAVRTVHFSNGFWNSDGGYEFNLAIIAGLLALVDGGPGEPSVDAALGIHDTGSGWALAALAAGAAGSAATIQFGGSTPQPGPEAAQQAAEVTSAPAPAA
jgi:putative oxidoreductase